MSDLDNKPVLRALLNAGSRPEGDDLRGIAYRVAGRAGLDLQQIIAERGAAASAVATEEVRRIVLGEHDIRF